MKHEFMERVRSDLCHLCLKPRNHPDHDEQDAIVGSCVECGAVDSDDEGTCRECGLDFVPYEERK